MQKNPKEKSRLEKYTQISVLGTGGYAKVILVKKRSNGKIFAMKILKKKFIEQKKQVEHTITERNILISIEHPFIVKLHECFQNEKKLFFVLEYLSGGELFTILKKKSRLSENQALFYASQMYLALEYLHENDIIYRDLKPENVLLDRQGYIRITDFGLSKMKIFTPTTAYSMCGTPEYLAPEILEKEGHGKPVDWWTFGCIIHEMITSQPPFVSDNRNELFEKIKYGVIKTPKNVSPELADLFRKLFEKNPNKRLGSQKGPQEIKNHPWFKNMNWKALINKTIKAPFVPTYKGELDISNFEKEYTQLPINSVQDNNSVIVQNQQFDNFTYEKDKIIK